MSFQSLSLVDGVEAEQDTQNGADKGADKGADNAVVTSDASTAGLQTQCGVNFFILDSRRVLASARKVRDQNTSQIHIL